MSTGTHHELTPAFTSPRAREGMARPPGRLQALLQPDDWGHIRVALRLSAREIELVRHIFDGQKMLCIAAEMGISLGTAKTYIQRIYRKLRIHDQRELILTVLGARLASILPATKQGTITSPTRRP